MFRASWHNCCQNGANFWLKLTLSNNNSNISPVFDCFSLSTKAAFKNNSFPRLGLLVYSPTIKNRKAIFTLEDRFIFLVCHC